MTINFSDVNGDGAISALDALMVINSLAQAKTPVVSQMVVVVNQDDVLDDGSDVDGESTLTEQEPDVSNTDESVVDDGDAETTDETDPVDETEETTDEDATDVVDDSDDGVDPIDGGGLTDEDDDLTHCDDGHSSGSSHRALGFGRIPIRRIDASGLLQRFDANGDGSLTEDELPESLLTTTWMPMRMV